MTTTADDLVQRLRDLARRLEVYADDAATANEAADAIERRDAEIERLRAELDAFKRACLDARAILGFGDLPPQAESVPIPKLIVDCAKEVDKTFSEAERELAELRERFERAPAGTVFSMESAMRDWLVLEDE